MTKCFVQILGEFEPRYKEWKRINPKTLFGDDDYSYLCNYHFKASEIGETHVKRVEEAMLRLAREGMFRRADDGSWKYVNIIGETEYSASRGEFAVHLNQNFVPYLVIAKEQGGYTTFNACIARQFNGKYTERFYEFIQEYRLSRMKKFFLTMDEMRERFGLTAKDNNGRTKYNCQIDFIRKVIEPSREEMKKFYDEGTCDVYFEWEIHKEDKTIKNGKRLESDRIWFIIHEKEIQLYIPGSPKDLEELKKLKLQKVEMFPQLLERLRNIYQTIEPDSKYVDNIIKPLTDAVAADDKMIFKFMERLDELERNADVQNLPGIVRHILEADYRVYPVEGIGAAQAAKNVTGLAAGLANKWNINNKK